LNFQFGAVKKFRHLRNSATSFIILLVLEGRRIAPGASRGRKVRTPQGVMPRNSSRFDWDTRGRKVGRLSDGKCHRKLNRHRLFEVVRVKRWCKRPPREAQATRHGKPHRVQGQIGNRGAARSAFRESETGFGYRSPRQMILSIRKGADRIRLTALPKPTSDLRLAIYDLRAASNLQVPRKS
jgi:hypothetical protein